MKKVIMYLSILVLVLAFVSCDSEVFNKLTDAMGIMNENVYGLEPNLEAVDDAVEEATSGVEVTVDGEGKKTATVLVVPGGSSLADEVGLTDLELDDSGVGTEDPVADLDFSEDNAEKIHEGVAKVFNSPEKKKAFVDALKKPVSDTNPEAVENALKIEKAKVKKLAGALPEGAASVILGSIDSIEIPVNPTMGDMMVIQLMANLAKKTSDRSGALTGADEAAKAAAEEAILEEAFKTLETIKTIGKASSVDLVSIFNIDALLGGRSTSRASIEDTFANILEDSISSLIDQLIILSGIPADGTITGENVGPMINEFITLRTSYEAAAFSKNSVSWVSGENNAGKLMNYDSFVMTGDGKFELDDVLLYAMSVGITDMFERVGKTPFVTFLNAIIVNKSGIQAAILADDTSAIPQAVQNAFAPIQTAYKDAFEDKEVVDVKKAFSVANTLLYLKWETQTDTPVDGDIEGKLVEIFGNGE